MILACPACGTRFAVDARAVGPAGRRVKCSRCGHVWYATPTPEAAGAVLPEAAGDADFVPPPAEATPGEPLPGAEAAPPMAVAVPPAPAHEAASGRGAGWAALAFAVIAVLAAGWLLRTAIVEAWPAAARLYAALGLAPAAPGEGLAIEVGTPERRAEAGGAVVIEGTVTNRNDREVAVPRLQATARRADGTPIARWTFTASSTRLGPGETASFSTPLDPGAADAADVVVGIAPPEGGGRTGPAR